MWLVPHPSGSTLLEIKKSFRNVGNVLYDWSGDDYCSWRGVLCDNVTFAVAALYDHRPLKLPPFQPTKMCGRWRWLVPMHCSNLSGLNLGGEISPAVGSLKSLVSMYGWFLVYPNDRADCSFLTEGTLCALVCASSDLKSNGLSGQIPDEIGDCSSLKTL